MIGALLNRDRFLLFLGMDERRWATRYGLEQFVVPCSSCGADLTTSVPFAFEMLRGFIAPRCTCGSEDTPYCFVRAIEGIDLFTAAEARDSKARVWKRTGRRGRALLRLADTARE